MSLGNAIKIIIILKHEIQTNTNLLISKADLKKKFTQ